MGNAAIPAITGKSKYFCGGPDGRGPACWLISRKSAGHTAGDSGGVGPQDLNHLPAFEDVNPTAEHIARHLYQRLSAQLNDAFCRLHRVRVGETPGTPRFTGRNDDAGCQCLRGFCFHPGRIHPGRNALFLHPPGRLQPGLQLLRYRAYRPPDARAACYSGGAGAVLFRASRLRLAE